MDPIVSILAHPERWALPRKVYTIILLHLFQSSPTPKGGRYPVGTVRVPVLCTFQSSPTPKGGRYDGLLALFPDWLKVSILAHPERWALRCARFVVGAEKVFQSSPTRKVGATMGCISYDRQTHSFNPRPPRKVGATVFEFRDECRRRVSILAHPERWALPAGPGSTPRGRPGFNPRPPRKVGATAVYPVFHRVELVSILAHPERWALPGSLMSLSFPYRVSILAHPERWALRGRNSERYCDDRCFNPRPPRKVGATEAVRHLRGVPRCFQSSPTPKGGRYTYGI